MHAGALELIRPARSRDKPDKSRETRLADRAESAQLQQHELVRFWSQYLRCLLIHWPARWTTLAEQHELPGTPVENRELHFQVTATDLIKQSEAGTYSESKGKGAVLLSAVAVQQRPLLRESDLADDSSSTNQSNLAAVPDLDLYEAAA